MNSLPSVEQIAQSFSQAAQNYDDVAGLQRQAADRLLAIHGQAVAGRVMDLGCGTGYVTGKLLAASNVAQVTAVDIAPGMLQLSRQRFGDQVDWLLADAQSMAVASASHDAIVSSLAIQWCADLPALFSNLARVLKPGGEFIAATLGPNTLQELRWAWQQVDDYQHVNEFVAAELLQQAIMPTFASLQWQTESIELKFDKVSEILRSLKQLGASNHNSGARHGLTTKSQLKAMQAAYESLRDEQGKLSVTYEVYYFKASNYGQPHG